MQEEFNIKRRNKLKKHYVNTSKVLLYGYQQVVYEEAGEIKTFRLSDAAKLTYQILDGHDWPDEEGESKGFVYPSMTTLAEIRGLSKRTIFDHIDQLIKAKLLQRVPHKNKPSDLYIEEVSDLEINRYLDKYVNKKSETHSAVQPHETEVKTTNAENCIPEKAGGMQKIAFAYKVEKKEEKENEINVNENFQFAEPKKRYGMQGLNDILKRIDREEPKTVKQKPKKEKPEYILKRNYLADEIALALDDQKSLGAFRKIAELVPEGMIRETLANIKETWREGKIKKSRGALFIDIIKTYCSSHGIDLPFHQTGSIEEAKVPESLFANSRTRER